MVQILKIEGTEGTAYVCLRTEAPICTVYPTPHRFSLSTVLGYVLLWKDGRVRLTVNQVVYLVIVVSLGVLAVVVSLWDKFGTPRYRPLRAGKEDHQ
jgi:hypothetical protein